MLQSPPSLAVDGGLRWRSCKFALCMATSSLKLGCIDAALMFAQHLQRPLAYVSYSSSYKHFEVLAHTLTLCEYAYCTPTT